MKAVIITKSGGVDELQLQDVEEPTTPDDHVKIRTKAFGLNRAETYFRTATWVKLLNREYPV